MFGSAKKDDKKKSPYYFLNGPHQEVEVEEAPEGTTEEEFAPRVLTQQSPSPYIASRKKAAIVVPQTHTTNNSNRSQSSNVSGGIWGRVFGQVPSPPPRPNAAGTLLKQRKAPVKIEPKVFFSNERTFLAWMHLSVILAGASLAILAMTEDTDQSLYGVVLLPVAISFIIYSMYQYQRRATMIRNRHPGPYEDTVGPVVLGVMLMLSIVAQFVLKLYAMRTSAV